MTLLSLMGGSGRGVTLLSLIWGAEMWGDTAVPPPGIRAPYQRLLPLQGTQAPPGARTLFGGVMGVMRGGQA